GCELPAADLSGVRVRRSDEAFVVTLRVVLYDADLEAAVLLRLLRGSDERVPVVPELHLPDLARHARVDLDLELDSDLDSHVKRPLTAERASALGGGPAALFGAHGAGCCSDQHSDRHGGQQDRLP